MNRTTLMGLMATLALLLGITVFTAPHAEAHGATGQADCTSARIDADSYDPAEANTYSLSLDGVTKSGTFGASVQVAIPTPQDGKVHTWSYDVQAADGSYHFADSGTVGPCGTPPPPVVHPKKAWVHFVRYCNAVKIEGRHAIAAVRSDHKDGVWRFFIKAKEGHVFANGYQFLGRSIHVKRTGCGDVSGY